jgi:hypothetical protein
MIYPQKKMKIIINNVKLMKRLLVLRKLLELLRLLLLQRKHLKRLQLLQRQNLKKLKLLQSDNDALKGKVKTVRISFDGFFAWIKN